MTTKPPKPNPWKDHQELKPCHCGGKMELISCDQGYYLECEECCEGSSVYGDSDILRKFWNTRNDKNVSLQHAGKELKK